MMRYMMLTQNTLDAIILLCEAERRRVMGTQFPIGDMPNSCNQIYQSLINCGLLDSNGYPKKSLFQTSLLDVITMMHEKIYPVSIEEMEEKIYKKYRYSRASQRLGVINQMMHDFLMKVDITDLMMNKYENKNNLNINT